MNDKYGAENKNGFLLYYISFHLTEISVGKSKIKDFKGRFCAQPVKRKFDFIVLLFVLSSTNVASL